jgi:lipoprotein|nr:MAG TPA: LPS-assembly protein [Caudoviricetes sp.]
MRYVLIWVILLTSLFIGGCGDTSVKNQPPISASREEKLNYYITSQSDELIEKYKDSDVFSHRYTADELSIGDYLPKTFEYMDSKGYKVDSIRHDDNTALYFVSKTMYFYSNANKGVTVTYRKK